MLKATKNVSGIFSQHSGLKNAAGEEGLKVTLLGITVFQRAYADIKTMERAFSLKYFLSPFRYTWVGGGVFLDALKVTDKDERVFFVGCRYPDKIIEKFEEWKKSQC